MGSAGTIWDTADVITKARMNQKTAFIGTGAEINAISTTYPGQSAYCTSTGSGFTAGEEYKRNVANDAWLREENNVIFGDGSDGDVTISSNTDLTSANNKNYNNLTINSGITLQGNTGMIIKVKGTLTFTDATSIIHVNGKGGAGADASAGDGGGGVFVFAKTISGVGYIKANGTDATAASGSGSGTPGDIHGAADDTTKGKTGVAAAVGGYGGGYGGTGGDAQTGFSQVHTLSIVPSLLMFGFRGSGGGGSENSNGSGGGGSGGFVYVVTYDAFPAVVLQALGGASPSTTRQGTGGGGGIIYALSKTGVASVVMTVTGGTGRVAGNVGATVSSVVP